MNDAIFDESINRVKAKSFDFIATKCAKLEDENKRLIKIIDTLLENCDECNGTGIKEKSTYMGDDTPCTCCFCEGTGKQPK